MEVLTPDEGAQALSLARSAILTHLGGGGEIVAELAAVFSARRGVFVTLKSGGALRGCIGFPTPVLPLGDAITEAAVAAASQDPRFPPVTLEEVPVLDLEVTVLTVPVPLHGDPDDRGRKVEVGRHGLIVRGYGRSGLLLPQVAVEQDWDAATFLAHTCNKAGLPPQAWRERAVEVSTFEGQIFHE
jgi:hypothetical protein